MGRVQLWPKTSDLDHVSLTGHGGSDITIHGPWPATVTDRIGHFVLEMLPEAVSPIQVVTLDNSLLGSTTILDSWVLA